MLGLMMSSYGHRDVPSSWNSQHLLHALSSAGRVENSASGRRPDFDTLVNSSSLPGLSVHLPQEQGPQGLQGALILLALSGFIHKARRPLSVDFGLAYRPW